MDKFTNGHAENFLACKRMGLTTQDAAQSAGLHRSTVYAWLAQGRAASLIAQAGFALTDAQAGLAAFARAFDEAQEATASGRSADRLRLATQARDEAARAKRGPTHLVGDTIDLTRGDGV